MWTYDNATIMNVCVCVCVCLRARVCVPEQGDSDFAYLMPPLTRLDYDAYLKGDEENDQVMQFSEMFALHKNISSSQYPPPPPPIDGFGGKEKEKGKCLVFMTGSWQTVKTFFDQKHFSSEHSCRIFDGSD